MATTPQATALYCRISKDLNGSGLGVDRQKELCSKLADDKGWIVGQVYIDNDISAYSGAPRPQYEKMLADLEAGAVDGVVVVDQDRLTRHPAELEDFIILADRLAIPLANVSGDIDLSTSDGRFRARILGAVARQESEKKSERLKRQKDQSASRGWAQGGRRRYGYKHARTDDDKATLDIVHEEAEIVREAASRYLSGESLRKIAIDLNHRGIPTATGKTWRVTTLKTMLTGPHVAGLRVHRGEIVGSGNWEPILDRPTWEQIRARLGDPRQNSGQGRPATHLLTGILKCGKCGATLHHTTHAYGRYSCDSPPFGCAGIAISAEPVEQVVSSMVLEALDSPAMAEALTEAQESPDADGITRQIEQAEINLDELARHYYTEHHISEREFLVARNALEAKISDLRGQLTPEPPSGRLVGAEKPLRELWDEADTDTRREIISTVVEKIVVGPAVRGRNFFDPGRVSISWRV
jgi:site-specific DNA recombinase